MQFLKKVSFTCHDVMISGYFVSNADGMCQSEYLEQPPDQLTCNPYVNTELKLECTISLLDAGTLSGRLTVDWFYSASAALGNFQVSPDNPLAISRLDNMQENVTIREQVMGGAASLRVRSRLEVLRLDETDVGQYWCGIRIDSMEWMILSDPVLLQEPKEYADLLPCSPVLPQSKRERKCATWSFKPPVPPIPIAPQPTEFPPLTLPTLQITEAGLQTLAGTTVQVTVSSTETLQSDDGPLMEFYIAIGILVASGSIITALVSLVACMCVKYRIILRGMSFANPLQAIHQLAVLFMVIYREKTTK